MARLCRLDGPPSAVTESFHWQRWKKNWRLPSFNFFKDVASKIQLPIWKYQPCHKYFPQELVNRWPFDDVRQREQVHLSQPSLTIHVLDNTKPSQNPKHPTPPYYASKSSSSPRPVLRTLDPNIIALVFPPVELFRAIQKPKLHPRRTVRRFHGEPVAQRREQPK